LENPKALANNFPEQFLFQLPSQHLMQAIVL